MVVTDAVFQSNPGMMESRRFGWQWHVIDATQVLEPPFRLKHGYLS
jgi:hypothetical protein